MIKFNEMASKIDPAEEKSVWEAFWATPSDSELRMRLVDLYLPLVLKIVNQLVIRIQRKMRAEDLIGSGVIGLHDAISNFSRTGGAAFSTFAYKRVKGAVQDQLRTQDHLTRSQRQCYKEICTAMTQLSLKLSRPPTEDELAAETGLTNDEIQQHISMASCGVSLHDEVGSEGAEVLDFLADDKTPSPDDDVDKAMSMDRLGKVVRLLCKRDQQLLFLRHVQELSVKEIAAVFDVSEGRVSQLYKQMLLRLRALMDAGAGT